MFTKMLVIGIVALVAVLVFLNMGDGILLAPASTQILLEPGSIEVTSEGQQAVLTVLITEVEDLYSWQVDLRWEGSATFMEAALPSAHVFAGQECYGPFISLASRQVVIGCSLLGDEPSFSGDGVLVEVTFRLSGVGNIVNFWIREEETILVDSELNEIPFGVG